MTNFSLSPRSVFAGMYHDDEKEIKNYEKEFHICAVFHYFPHQQQWVKFSPFLRSYIMVAVS